MFNKSFEKRFWKKVEIIPFHDCWEWTASKTKGGNGYGQISYSSEGDMIKAHRASYIMHQGAIPDGLMVCHKCDNPGCVRPDHLFLGTAQVNHDDRGAKGRTARGERSGAAKINDAQAMQIKLRLSLGESPREIAPEFGVCRNTVYAIRAGRIWKHLNT